MDVLHGLPDRGIHGVASMKKALPWIVVIAVAVWGFAVLQEKSSQLNQTSQRTQLEQLRSCVRANISGAVARINADLPTPGLTATERALKKRRAVTLYPLVDCKSSLEGPAVLLSPIAVREYKALVKVGRAPIISHGKVVGYRRTLLEGVNAVSEAGKR